MPDPMNIPGLRVCIAISPSEVKLYGNREAFKTLALWMQSIADGDPAEHYELHTFFHLSNEETLTGRTKHPNIWVLRHRSLEHIIPLRSDEDSGFDIAFMAVEESDLDEMAKYQNTGFIPDQWHQE